MSALTDPRIKPHVREAAKEISERFGIQNIGGFATSGHITNSDHYTGLAIDVMTSIKGQQVADFAVANAKRLSITYVIWNRHIWDSRDGKGWVPYHGTSPHTDHVHISFYPQASNGGPIVNTIAGQSFGDTSALGCLGNVLKLFNPAA